MEQQQQEQQLVIERLPPIHRAAWHGDVAAVDQLIEADRTQLEARNEQRE